MNKFVVHKTGNDEYQIVDEVTRTEICTIVPFEGEIYSAEVRAKRLAQVLNNCRDADWAKGGKY